MDRLDGDLDRIRDNTCVRFGQAELEKTVEELSEVVLGLVEEDYISES